MKTITLFLMLLISSNLFSQKILKEFTLGKDTYEQIVSKYNNAILTTEDITHSCSMRRMSRCQGFQQKK